MTVRLMFSWVFALLLLGSQAYAAPGIPHQFYGSIYVNGQPVSDNTVLVAGIESDEYSTITRDSLYGKSPAPIFYVPDPEGERSGETITFLLGGMNVGTYTFENNGYTEMNFNVTTECGDGYCIGDETCDTCAADCGECPVEPLNVYIHSPVEDEVYDTARVPLEVSSNQEIRVWWYTLNSGGAIVFNPNTTINAKEGENQIFVFAKDLYNQVGSNMVLNFTVELPKPECGNDIKEEGEECDGTDLGALTCSSYGFNSGTLGCSSECTIILNDCRNVVQSTTTPSSSEGTGGGGGGGYVPPAEKNETDDESPVEQTVSTTGDGGEENYVCTRNWVCSEWNECEEGTQKRNCVDVNNCGTEENMPFESQECTEEIQQSTSPTGLAFLTPLQNPAAIAVIALLLLAIAAGVGLKKGLIKF